MEALAASDKTEANATTNTVDVMARLPVLSQGGGGGLFVMSLTRHPLTVTTVQQTY